MGLTADATDSWQNLRTDHGLSQVPELRGRRMPRQKSRCHPLQTRDERMCASEDSESQTFMKIGIVGSGFIAQTFVTAMAQVRGMHIEALLDRRRSVSLADRIRAQDLGNARIVPSISEMVDHVDAILLACPNDARISAVEEIVARVKSGSRLSGLMCDKPLGRNVEESRRLVELAREIEIPTAYLENQVFMKSIRAQKQALAAAYATQGPLVLVRSSQEHAGPHEGWFWDPKRSGGGVLNDMGCHSIGVGWWMLLGPGDSLQDLEPVSVTAEVACLKWGHAPWAARLKKKWASIGRRRLPTTTRPESSLSGAGILDD